MSLHEPEGWLTVEKLAAYLGCSLRWVRYRAEEGMPHAVIAGRRKFRVSEVEAWLEKKGHLERKGELVT
jgi:excisionase family DNA binding protein